MSKELFTSEKSKLRFELISNVLKNSNGKFLLGDKVSCLFSAVFHSQIDNTNLKLNNLITITTNFQIF